MKYRKKPVVIEAVQFTGDNFHALLDFTNKEMELRLDGRYYIPTLEGEHEVSIGDYVIKGVKGEFYPCKPDIFEMTYEKVKEM